MPLVHMGGHLEAELEERLLDSCCFYGLASSQERQGRKPQS